MTVGPAKDIIDRLGADCKEGGSFYVCDGKDVPFIGCCDGLDPCKTSDGSCPNENLRNTTFNKDKYEDIKAQGCVSDQAEVQWFTCTGFNPPFMGCCDINPCANQGCPADSLYAAKLSDLEENAASFLSDGDEDAGLSGGAIAGVAVGATVGGLAIIAAIVFFFWRRRKNNQKAKQEVSQERFGHQGSPSNVTTAYGSQSPGLGSHYDPKHVSSPLGSTYAPSMAGHGYDPLQQNAGSPSPQMSQDAWRQSANTNLGVYQHGYAPSSISSATGDHTSYQHMGHQNTLYPSMVQELPAQEHLVELPEDNRAPAALTLDSEKRH